jgi:hypothetical protein
MSAWRHIYNGLSKLGQENTPDYRGYVVRIESVPHPETWFTYAYDQEGQHTYWIGKAGSEEAAKAILDRLLREGWTCEVYDRDAGRHCTGAAAVVKHTWYERAQLPGERLRLILCEGHSDSFPNWERMGVSAYIRAYNGLEQDAPILGPRI